MDNGDSIICYLDNGDKFMLFSNALEVIFILYSHILEGPAKTSARWIHKSTLDINHLKKLKELLTSDVESNRKVGKAFLENMVKYRIHGEIIK